MNNKWSELERVYFIFSHLMKLFGVRVMIVIEMFKSLGGFCDEI